MRRVRLTEEYGSVHLLAVSKTKPASDIAALFRLGQRQFGENYVQEAVDRIDSLSDLDIKWHYQTNSNNKTKIIATAFDWVHTVDREKIMKRLDEAQLASL